MMGPEPPYDIDLQFIETELDDVDPPSEDEQNNIDEGNSWSE